ncbi:hypothetical protein ACVCAH_34205 [Micromonospora sp. LZ34]
MSDPTAPMPEQPATPTPPAAQSHVPLENLTPDPELSQTASPPAPTPTKRSNVQVWAVGGLALVIALTAGLAIGAVAATDADSAASASSSASPTTAAPTTAAPTTAAPSTAAPTSAAPSPTKTTPPPKPKPPSYKTLSERQWKLIAKNPDAYIGETYVVYGVVTQFDAATGVGTFRADVAHRRMADEWDYETNTLLTGSAAALDNLVEDDIFRAKVMVLSSFSYGTQIGGETTVPLLQVDSIKVL